MYLFSEIKFPDLVCGLKLNKLGNSSVHYEIGLFSNFEEKTAAKIIFIHVFCRYKKTRKPKKIPSKIIRTLKIINERLN